MANLLDGLLPGNRVVTVNGARPAIARDTLEIEALGASITDDPTNKRTIVALPNAGNSASAWSPLTIAIAGALGGGTIGNGSIAAFWRLASVDTVEIAMLLTFGSTTSFGSGALDLLIGTEFALRFDTTKLPGGIATSGHLYLADSSTPTNNKGGTVNVIDQTTLRMLPHGTATELSATVPFAWATGDTIRMWVSLPVRPHE